MLRLLLPTLFILGSTSVIAEEMFPPAEPSDEGNPTRFTLVEEFTADTLAIGEFLIGNTLEVGLTDTLMFGTDLDSTVVGAPNIQTKGRIWWDKEHKVAIGVRAAWLNKKTLLWGSMDDHFEELDAKMVRPSISWTNTLSPRLKLHAFWAKGFGKISATLSEKGRRSLWEAKHPGSDWETRNTETQEPTEGDNHTEVETDENQEKGSAVESAPAQRSIQVQSLAGLAQERFQFTSEFSRQNGNKILVSSRIEKTVIESLTSSTFRLTAAHHWIWNTFQMRLGVGAQYYVISGEDLDDEQLDETGTQPASDIAFYWRF